jgi:hypothetical protein
MKKFLLLGFLWCIIFAAVAQDEKTDFPYKNTIKLSPLSVYSSSFNLNYERRIGKDMGIFISEGICYVENDEAITLFSSSYEGTGGTMSGYLSELQFRYYFHSKQKMQNNWNRFFFAPYGFYRQYQINDYYYYLDPYTQQNKKDYTINSFGGGCLIGYCLEANKFSFEVFTGGGIKLSNTDMSTAVEEKYKDNVLSPAYEGIVLKLGINIGFNF